MKGYKQIGQLTLEECFNILEHEENQSVHEEVMARFKSLVQDLPLKACHDFVQTHQQSEGNPCWQMVEEQRKKRIVEYQEQENNAYNACKTIDDFDTFIAKYSLMKPAYQALHIEEAIRYKEVLVERARQRENARRQREWQRVQERQQCNKRILLIVMLSLVAAAVVVFFIGYHPAKTLSVGDVVFGKEGGRQTLRIETNVGPQYISVDTPKVKWAGLDQSGDMVSVTAEPNEGLERSCTIEVEVYSTFFGKRIGSSKSQTVVIRQRSGYASHIIPSEQELRFSQYGDSKIINIKTDGVKLQLSSLQSWIQISPKEQRHDGQYYHDDDFEITVGKNPNESQKGVLLVESGGMVKEIDVYQTSGHASELVSPSMLGFGKFGETKHIAVKTDGVSLELKPTVDWIKCRRIRHDSNQRYYNDDEYEISVETNLLGDKTGKILVQTGGQESEIMVDQKSGLAKKLKVDKSAINNVGIKGTSYGKYFVVKVDTDGTSWDVRTDRRWISVSKVDNTVRIMVENNEGGDVRDGSVYISSNNGHKKTVDVHQDGNPTTFYSEYSRWTFDTERESKYITVNNNSHQPIQVSSNKKWLSAYMAGSSVKVSCESNNSSSRDGKITLTCGNKKTEISIHQKGWTSCTNGYRSWTDAFGGSFFYTYENGRHVLKHAYTSWEYNAYYGGTMPYPRVDVETCKACEGKGRIKQD